MRSGDGTRLEDGRRGAAREAAGRVERVGAEELVEEAAGDAEHRRAAVLALRVELEGLGLRVVVAHPADAGDVARLRVNGLRLREREERRLVPAPVSCMQQKSMIWSQPKVGIDSSEASMPVGAARHSSVGILTPASTRMTWRKPSMAARPCLISMIS